MDTTRRIADLRQMLLDAFPGRPVPDMPKPKGDMDLRTCYKALSNKDWRQVTPEEYLDACECLTYLTPSLSAYYLPGFITAVLDTWPRFVGGLLFLGIDSQLVETSPEHPLRTLLNVHQKGCVRAYLEFIVDNRMMTYDREAKYREAVEAWY